MKLHTALCLRSRFDLTALLRHLTILVLRTTGGIDRFQSTPNPHALYLASVALSWAHCRAKHKTEWMSRSFEAVYSRQSTQMQMRDVKLN